MSELKIREFRARATLGVHLPDLAVLERRGRALRRRRAVAALGGAAVVLAAGAGLVTLSANAPAPTVPEGPAALLSGAPSPGVLTTQVAGDPMVLPGHAELALGDFTYSFEVTGRRWELWDVGVVLRTGAEPDRHSAALVFVPDPSVRLDPCRTGRWTTLGSDPDDRVGNVAPLLHLAHSRVQERPRVVSAFGETAVHLRVQAAGPCAYYGEAPAQLRGRRGVSFFDRSFEGWHTLDLWHLLVEPDKPGLLVAVWDLDRDGTHPGPVRSLLESLRVEAR